MSEPRFSVLLLTRNGGELFGRSLDALFRCRNVEQAEVLMVDSGSTDETVERASRYPIEIHHIPHHEFGHGRTRNLAARLASGRILVFLVQDAVPTGPDFLEQLTAPLERPDVAATYGRQAPQEEADPVERFYVLSAYPDRPRTLESRSRKGPRRIRSMFFSNVCSAIRRSVWKSHPFDETLIMSEDQKWAKEVLASGHKIVYVPEAVVRHSHHYGLKKVLQRNFDSGMSLVDIAEDSPWQMAAYELHHLASGLRYLVRRGEKGWIPRFLVHEVARTLGFASGRHSRLFPRSWRRAFSLHKGYWDSRSHNASCSATPDQEG